MLATEGHIRFHDYAIWYGIAGEREEPGKAPLLLVHGGPGLTHETLEPLATLAETGRRVVFYDQLGCGASSRPADPSAYSRALQVEELATVRRELGLNAVHLYGHSYGGALALEYVLTARPAGLVGLILSDTFASVPALVAGWHDLRAAFPPAVQATLRRHEEAGTVDSDEYNALLGHYFIAKHVLTVPPHKGLVRAQQRMNYEAYNALHGPSWFKATGAYATWDVTDRLGEITIPTLVIAGREDQCIPALSEAIQRGIAGAELVILEGASHVPFIEQPAAYAAALIAFLDRADRAAARVDRGVHA